MAEFQEVMRQWARMCNAVPGKSKCTGICRDKQSGYICPMHDCGLCNKSIAAQTDKDRLAGEKTIMAWAAENPEPVYPTWGQYFRRYYGLEYCKGKGHEMLLEHIPADIAQKLGIEPKEG